MIVTVCGLILSISIVVVLALDWLRHPELRAIDGNRVPDRDAHRSSHRPQANRPDAPRRSAESRTP